MLHLRLHKGQVLITHLRLHSLSQGRSPVGHVLLQSRGENPEQEHTPGASFLHALGDPLLETEGVAALDADSVHVRELLRNRAAVTSQGCGQARNY